MANPSWSASLGVAICYPDFVSTAVTARQPALQIRSQVILLCTTLATLLVFLWLGTEVHTSRTQAVDQRFRALVHAHASTPLTLTMLYATQLGSVMPLTGLSVVLFLVLLKLKKRRAAGLLALTMAGALLLNTFLKDSFQRARPEPFFGVLSPDTYSFPSGHSLLSFCFYGLLAAIYIPRLTRLSWRIAGWAVAALIILVIGFSRVYLGVHYPTDVVGGWIVALAWITLVIAVYPAKSQKRAAQRS